MKFPDRLRKFLSKSYRDGFLRTQIGGGIAYQVQALRAKLGLSQREFGELIGKPQTVISRLENSASGNVSVRTLLDIATGADVALLVQFVSYPEFLRRTQDMGVAALQPETIFESVEKSAGTAPPQLGSWLNALLRPPGAAAAQQGEGLDWQRPDPAMTGPLRDWTAGGPSPAAQQPPKGFLEHTGTMH